MASVGEYGQGSGGVELVVRSEKTEAKDVSQQVQARLKRADELEEAVASLTQQLSDRNEELGRARTELTSLRKFADKHDQLCEREKALDLRESVLNAREEINKLMVSHEKQRVDDHIKMVELVFRNAELRRSGMWPVAVGGGAGNCSYDNNGTPHYSPMPTYASQEPFSTSEQQQ